MCEVIMKTIQDRPPNFRNAEGQLFLVRCFNCDKQHGRENRLASVAGGCCAWCGWAEMEDRGRE